MTVSAFAKVNLTLEVLGKRPDGFHALRSVVAPIGLSDALTFEAASSFSTDTGYSDDLILKAVRALAAATPPAARQAYRISVAKRIPAGGGLGGGSADAAATLLALNGLWGTGLTPEELANVGASVGSDVPALVLANHYRRPVLMEGRGECVSPMEGVGGPCGGLVLVNPGVACSTAAVYGLCEPRATSDPSILARMCAALRAGDVRQVAAALMNDLQPPALRHCPEIGVALEALRAAGVPEAMMSGSGSTVFGLVASEAAGRAVAARLEDSGMRVVATAFVI